MGLAACSIPRVWRRWLTLCRWPLAISVRSVRIGASLHASPKSDTTPPESCIFAYSARVRATMFTGIIQSVGTIAALEAKGSDLRLRVQTGKLELNDVQMGDSIAVNGVCLTAVALPGDGF